MQEGISFRGNSAFAALGTTFGQTPTVLNSDSTPEFLRPKTLGVQPITPSLGEVAVPRPRFHPQRLRLLRARANFDNDFAHSARPRRRCRNCEIASHRNASFN